MNMIFLVDGDNNIGTGLQGIDLLTAEDTVLVFYGKGQTMANIQKLCAHTAAHVQYLESVKGGKNSIDFQIITELGVLVGRGEADFAYVISQDKGYEAAMSALRARYADTFQEVALRPTIQSCLQGVFLLRSRSREALAQALVREYGETQGIRAYAHLERLFAPGAVEEREPSRVTLRRRKKGAEEPELVPAEPEEAVPAAPAKKPGRRAAGEKAEKPFGRGRKAPVQEKPKKEPEITEVAAEPAAPEKPRKRTHRGGRRARKAAPQAE